jgi:hypothetical protein
MVGDTERGVCRGRDLPSVMPIACERMRERHREAGRMGGGRKFLGSRRTRPVGVASGPKQRQFAAGALLEVQASSSALELSAPDNEGAALLPLA